MLKLCFKAKGRKLKLNKAEITQNEKKRLTFIVIPQLRFADGVDILGVDRRKPSEPNASKASYNPGKVILLSLVSIFACFLIAKNLITLDYSNF